MKSMNLIFRKGTIALIFLFLTAYVVAQSGTVKQTKLTDFNLQSSVLIDDDGQTLSTATYQSPVYWFPVKVPSTVLTGLVANHIYPDPYSGLNNMLIPDASDSFNKKYNLEQYSFLPNDPNPWKKPYWYRTTFKVPLSDQGRHFQLIFKGINYRASVWVNGHQIADSTQMAGMFAEYSLDVSKEIMAGHENALAIKIYPLDFPGTPAEEQLKAMGPFFENGGPTGDIGQNVTMLCSVGWDWIPPVRDRNMGIWQPVYLRTSGAVTIGSPHLVTALPQLPDTTKADLSLSLSLYNAQNKASQGKVVVTIAPENFQGQPFSFFETIALKANQSSIVSFEPGNEPLMKINNPHLWWSFDHGKPNLYRIRLQYIEGNQVSDDTSFVFGIRTVSSKLVEVPGKYPRRDFYVNGKRVNLVGGAWVPDMMLNRDSARYDHELLLCRNANANLIRIWGGGITPPDAFFDAADRYGLLVWSDFWITGDTQGQFKGSPDWPLQHNVFIQNMTSTIQRIRNHPSLLVWTGGNEGHACKELYNAMRDSLISLDGTRPFIPCSSGFAKLPSDWKGSWPDNGPSGVYSGGPYEWKTPNEYYDLADNAKDWVFKDETGIPSQPPYSILHKIIPDLVWDKNDSFPLNNSWGYHDACTGSGRYDLYYEDMSKRFGKPVSLKDFSLKMQLMNAMGYQGIFEAAGHKLNDNGGVLLWKLNAAFPSVIWQIYDWYLEPNAGYYFMQNACEPTHVQFDRDDSTVVVVNRSYRSKQEVTVEADGYTIQSKSLFHQTITLHLTAGNVQTAFSLTKKLNHLEGVTFVVLTLKDTVGKTISNNSYWLAPKEDFNALTDMPQTHVNVKLEQTKADKSNRQWTFQLTNPSDRIAFFVRLQLVNHGEEVLPSFWSANYVMLQPHQSMMITVDVPKVLLKGNNASVQIEGWNLTTEKVALPALM
jgi:exo-1,4-beta-D-glucosaminidase